MDTSTLPQVGGIYQWRQLSTGRKYIGSTNNFLNRYRDHLSALERRNHYNRHFNHAWLKYGAIDFIFEILEIIGDDSLLMKREQWYLDNVVNFSFDFNQAREAAKGPSMKGMKQARPRRKAPSPSPETIEKRAQKLRGRKRSQETVDKVNAANRGKVRTEEMRAAASEYNKSRGVVPPSDSMLSDEALKRKYAKGRKHSDESRRKMSESLRKLDRKTFLGREHSEESKRKMADKKMGRTMSEETKKKMSDAQLNRRAAERLRRPGR